MSNGNRRYYAALGGLVAALLLGAAVEPPSKPQSAPQAAPASPNANADGGKSLAAVDRESLALDRTANRIAERANLIAEAQRSYALWQLVLGGAGVVFTGLAAAAAVAAALYAREAAAQAKRSADADNAALAETRAAAEDARKDAVQQAKRAREQIDLMDQTMQFTAQSAYAMQASAKAATDSVALSGKIAGRQLRPYLYLTKETVKLEILHMIDLIGDVAEITIEFKNFGQTPAKAVILKAKCFVGGYWSEDFISDLGDATTIHLGDFPPGFSRTVDGYTAHGIKEAYPYFRGAAKSIIIDGVIEYQDAGGERFSTQFRRACTGPDIETRDDPFYTTPNGNEAT